MPEFISVGDAPDDWMFWMEFLAYGTYGNTLRESILRDWGFGLDK